MVPGGEVERPKVVPGQPVDRRLKSNDRLAKLEPKSTPAPEPEVGNHTADPTKRSIATGKMKPAFRYGFAKDNRYAYSVTVKSSFNKRDVSVIGAVVYTVGEVGGKIRTNLIKDLPDQVMQLPNLMHVSCVATAGTMTGARSSQHQSSWTGDLVCDDSGQVHKKLSFQSQHGGKEDNYLLPFVYAPPERVGIVDFPNDGSTNWSEEGGHLV